MDRFRDVPFVTSLLHPTDFSSASDEAFAHALAIALRRPNIELTLLHVSGDDTPPWTQFPAVRGTLQRWGLLAEDSTKSAVYRQLQIDVKKVGLRSGKPLKATLEFLDRNPTDLIVLATEAREGLPQWLRPSMAEALARHSETMTLFVPHDVRGFVSLEDGSSRLRRMLVPIDHKPNPRPAVVYAARAAALGDGRVDICTLHVGSRVPNIELPQTESVEWTTLRRDADDVVDTILETAGKQDIDLIVMPTDGRDGILDALRGSVTEQVLRRAPCPLVAVPSA